MTCIRGHDTSTVGRNGSGTCRACVPIHARQASERRSLRWADPTPAQLQALALVLLLGDQGAADRLGCTPSAVRMQCSRLYDRIGAIGKIDAAVLLGWLRIPPRHLE